MKEFKTYHPIVNFTYFLTVIGFSMVFMHPVCLAISLAASLCYSIMLGGKKAIKFNLIYMLPLLVITSIMNPLFNHEGVTILCYLPSENPLTLESILYGMSASVMLISVISWFSCFNKIITSDKLMYLFGKIIPALSLIFSMVLRFVPKFKAQIKTVSNAQKCVGRDVSNGSVIQRAKNGIKILSIMITWSLENAIDTADSMKSRGYGLGGRTAFSNYNFSKRDALALGTILLISIYIIVNAFVGQMEFRYYPSLKGVEITLQSISVFLAYFLLCVTPIIIEIKEAYKWKLLKSKI
jgi:energy-coupling factor transport system permease protein